MATTGTVMLSKVIKATPEKVYKAFTDPLALASWIPPWGILCEVQEMNVEVGGTYKSSFTNFSTGKSHSFGGTYTKVQPNEVLQYNDQFDDPSLPGKMLTTIQLTKVSVGTKLDIKQEGIPAMIPEEMCYLGWQESIEKLTKLVEPIIPDN